ncbi:MAG: DUF192 domain-containing protein [Acidimicrobiales bacterium]
MSSDATPQLPNTPDPSTDGWWLLRNGDVLAAAEVAKSVAALSKGLLGKKEYEGALLLRNASAVFTIGMRFSIDVAFLDKRLRVVDIKHLAPWRITLPRLRTRHVLEAQSGAFDRWGLRVGDELELRRGE